MRKYLYTHHVIAPWLLIIKLLAQIFIVLHKSKLVTLLHHHLEKEINCLIANSLKKPFKNNDSIFELKGIYEQLLRLRDKVITQYPGFPGDPPTDAIITLLTDITHSKMDVKKVEWSYDHYIDLFKFKAEELLLETLERMKKPETFKS